MASTSRDDQIQAVVLHKRPPVSFASGRCHRWYTKTSTQETNVSNTIGSLQRLSISSHIFQADKTAAPYLYDQHVVGSFHDKRMGYSERKIQKAERSLEGV